MTERKGGDPKTNGCDCLYCRISREIRRDGEYLNNEQVVEVAYTLARHLGGVLIYADGRENMLSMLKTLNAVTLDEVERIQDLPAFQAEQEAMRRPRA